MNLDLFRRWRPGLAALAVAGLAVGLVACGGDDENDANAAPDGESDSGSASLTVEDAYARFSKDDLGAAYFTITGGDEDDRLVGITAEGIEIVEMHETVTEGNSGQMQAIEGGVEVPAGETVAFEPGQKHVMLINPEEPLEVGDTLDLTLEFESAGEITVTAEVEGFGASPETDEGTQASGGEDGHSHEEGDAQTSEESGGEDSPIY